MEKREPIRNNLPSKNNPAKPELKNNPLRSEIKQLNQNSKPLVARPVTSPSAKPVQKVAASKPQMKGFKAPVGKTVNKPKPKINLPKNELAEALFRYGVKFSRTDMKRAEIYFLEYIKLINDNVNAYYNLGVIYSSLGERQKAIQYYQEALKLDGNSYNILYNLGNEYFYVGLYDQAEECYLKITESQPEPYDCLINLASLYLYCKLDYPKALEIFKRLSLINRKSPDILFNLALCYELSEDIDTSIKYYQDALNLDPNHYQSLFNLASIYNKTFRKNKALPLFQKYLQIPDKPMKEYTNVQTAIKRVKEMKAEGL